MQGVYWKLTRAARYLVLWKLKGDWELLIHTFSVLSLQLKKLW